MSRRGGLIFILCILSFAALIGGILLVGEYNTGTAYASKVPTATQTVKLCHNECRYLAPQIAFRLYFGMALGGAGCLALGFIQVWERSTRRR